MKPTLELAMELILRNSVTPVDGGCQRLIAGHLEKIGFTAKHLRFSEVDNLWITNGKGAPYLIYIGHTDVVPPRPAGKLDLGSIQAGDQGRISLWSRRRGHEGQYRQHDDRPGTIYWKAS
jgi:Acetylornithine deacetylase/Succinyl-diaminopimelate desuccinylase and related deacylases